MRGERVGQELFALIRGLSGNPIDDHSVRQSMVQPPKTTQLRRRIVGISVCGFSVCFCLHRNLFRLHPSS